MSLPAEGVNALAARLQAALAVSSSARPPAVPSPATSRSSPAPSPVSARMAGGRGEAPGRPATPDGGWSARVPDGMGSAAAAAAGADAGTGPGALGGSAQRCATGGVPAPFVRWDAGMEGRASRGQNPGQPQSLDPGHAHASSLRRASARLGAAVKLPGKPPPDCAALHPDGLRAALAEARTLVFTQAMLTDRLLEDMSLVSPLLSAS